MISSKNSEWASDDFNIFIYKNTRQVQAVYTKDESRIEISFSCPDTYPLQ